MKDNDWKKQLGLVYSTNPDALNNNQEEESNDNNATPPPAKQNLKIMLDKRNRNGKSVTLIVDFIGSESDLKDLAKELKTQCGVGGSARCGEILLQGDFRTKVHEILIKKGYKARII